MPSPMLLDAADLGPTSGASGVAATRCCAALASHALRAASGVRSSCIECRLMSVEIGAPAVAQISVAGAAQFESGDKRRDRCGR